MIGEVSKLVGNVLQLGGRSDEFDADTPLLGAIPEFDSMAVVSIITAIEEKYDIVIDDDDISSETFETIGSLAAFIDAKL